MSVLENQDTLTNRHTHRQMSEKPCNKKFELKFSFVLLSSTINAEASPVITVFQLTMVSAVDQAATSVTRLLQAKTV